VLLLLLEVLVPTAGVVWMMRAAVETNDWHASGWRMFMTASLSSPSASRKHGCITSPRSTPGRRSDGRPRSRRSVSSGIDSVWFWTSAHVQRRPQSETLVAETDSRWQDAERLEYVEGDPTGARAYQAMATSGDEQPAARAEQAVALPRVDRQDEAVALQTACQRDASDA
jgi:hypothetical protein